jgi:DNA-directed RNA polymerase sigma subunit (sigma70/sigma32)
MTEHEHRIHMYAYRCVINTKERDILIRHIVNAETFAAIGMSLNVSRQRVQQIYKKAKRHIADFERRRREKMSDKRGFGRIK